MRARGIGRGRFRPRWRALALALSVGLLVVAAGTVAAQDRPRGEWPDGARPVPSHRAVPPWRNRLLDADRLLRIGSLGRAETLLDEAERLGAPPQEVLRRRVTVAEATGDLERVVALCREGLKRQPADLALHRSLARALLRAGRPDEAEGSLQALLRGSPNAVATVGEVAAMERAAGYPARGLARVDSLRAVRKDPGLLARERAACLFALGRRDEAVDELLAELRRNPLNLPLVGGELLSRLVERDELGAVEKELRKRLADRPEARYLDVLVLLRLGRGADALAVTRPLLEGGGRQELRRLRDLVRDRYLALPALDDAAERRATATWLLEVLSALAARADRAGGRPRLLDMLAGVAEQALDAGILDDDPRRAVDRLQEILRQVREGSPGSTGLYAAEIRLAMYLRDRLHQPERAAASLRRLLADLDLPLRGVALARLALGECELAAGDTAAARAVLTRLGHDRKFPVAAARAQFRLAQLDLAQGAWETARDRLAAVALADPGADVTNDALDLGLLLAEELENPAGGPDVLALYAPVMYWRLRGDADRERRALRRLVAERARVPAVGDHPRPLLERARFELARLDSQAGRWLDAAAQCDTLAADFPDGHYPARALLLAGDALAAAGRRAAARERWERLLAQYPDAIEAEDARQRLRRP